MTEKIQKMDITKHAVRNTELAYRIENKMKKCDIFIVGGGTAGIAAANRIWKQNPELRILLADRETELGGVLRQCIHTGFGNANYSGELTGPQFLELLKQELLKTDVDILTETEVTEILLPEQSKRGIGIAITAGPSGRNLIGFQHMILAAGSYERPIGNLMISGGKPEGIFGAGELQRMINLEGYHPSGRAVIIGSGDIGLIVARRLIRSGCTISGIVELQDHSPAMDRNKKRCLEAYSMPLYLNSQVTEIHGTKKITGVTVKNRMTGENMILECDLLAAAAGLIPDRSLLRNLPEGWERYITLLGNCNRIYPIADAIVNAADLLEI